MKKGTIIFLIVVCIMTIVILGCPRPDTPPTTGALTTITINNFETDTAGTTTYPFTYGGDATVRLLGETLTVPHPIPDPPTVGATTGNASTKILEIQPNNYRQYVKLSGTLPEGTTMSDYVYLHVKAVFPDNGGDNQYKTIDVLLASSFGANGTWDETSIFWAGKSTSIGGYSTTWNHYFIALDPAKTAAVTGNTFEIAIGINGDGTSGAVNSPGPYYFDDIQIMPKAEAEKTFETDTAGTTTYPFTYGGDATVRLLGETLTVPHPIPDPPTVGATTGNASTRILEIQPNNYRQYVKLSGTLPEGTTMSDFGYIHVKAVFPDNGGDNQYKTIDVLLASSFGANGTWDETSIFWAGKSTSTGGYSTTWNDYFIAIDPTKTAAITGSTFEIAIGINGDGTSGAVNSPGPYYFDDIGFITK